MRKSARIIGQDYGLSSQEMNVLLKEEGYLCGEPGNYVPTEKGEKYAHEKYHSRGTGGYAQYNPCWTTLTWDDNIINELDMSDDRIRKTREAISAAKQKKKALDSVSGSNREYICKYVNIADDEDDSDNRETLVAVASTVLLMASIYGITKAAPHIKRWWKDKSMPRIKDAKDKIIKNMSQFK